MRDIALMIFIFAFIPAILKRPWIGIAMGAWISLMNPHRFTWGFAYDFPFAFLVAIVTVAAMVFSKEKITMTWHSVTVIMAALVVWMSVTTLFAFEPEPAYAQWTKVMKVFLLIFLAAMLIRTREQINIFLWVLVISIGWFGAKGGIFTIATGGAHRVYGPPGGSFVSDNNAISIALTMVTPLMLYLTTTVQSKIVKSGLWAAMLLSLVAILGSQSRGALLAVSAMCVFLWFKSRNKLVFGVILFGTLLGAIAFMPDSWEARMRSIQTYEEDRSALGRINTWTMAFNVANARPLVGGGFELYSPNTFARYAPDPLDIHSAHSIYFQMLGEHGYVGLALFLSLGLAGWITARRTIARSRDAPEKQWAGNLARAIQVSLIGFGVGGTFVNISYWELQYYLLVVLAAALRLISAPGDAKQGVEAIPAPRRQMATS